MRRRRPQPSRAHRSAGTLTLVAAAVVAALGTAAGGATAAPTPKPRVTMIGDSVAASFDYVPAARRYLGRGLDLRSDAVVCRRLVAASCTFQGTQPATALEVVRARRRALGQVVVINVGYNDWAAVYDVERVLRALKAAGVKAVVWVTLRETTSNYAQNNARIRTASRRWKSLVVADWNAASRGHAWFRSDGLHLTPEGAMALARILRPLVLTAVERA